MNSERIERVYSDPWNYRSVEDSMAYNTKYTDLIHRVAFCNACLSICSVLAWLKHTVAPSPICLYTLLLWPCLAAGTIYECVLEGPWTISVILGVGAKSPGSMFVIEWEIISQPLLPQQEINILSLPFSWLPYTTHTKYIFNRSNHSRMENKYTWYTWRIPYMYKAKPWYILDAIHTSSLCI